MGTVAVDLVWAEYQAARELATQGLSLAQRDQDRVLLLVAHHALGTTAYFLGEVSLARAHLEQGIALDNRQQHHHLAFRDGLDLGVCGLSCGAWPLWLLGYPEQAIQRCQEALTLAREWRTPSA